MAGLTGALNIAKNALLAFQTATQVISHNIANVNNESYSRQKVVETTYPPSPSPVGSIGTGVKIESIIRYFDAFLERNINLKKTDYGLFSAEESGLTILESLFNETQDSGLAKILRDFWSAWQNLANYPENLAARTQVIENGKLIAEALKAKFQGMKDLEDQIKLELQTLVERINKLSSQIAELNSQIVARESGGKAANDLRDQRDKMVSELAQLANIQYFETKEGAYNVILGKGLNLVNKNYNWQLEISGTDVYWVGRNGEKVPVTSAIVSSGELGGWLKLLEQLSDEYNHEYVSGNKAVINNHGNYITEGDKFVTDLGVAAGDTISFSGTDHFGNEISGTFTIQNDSTIRDFLNKIEEKFNYTVKAYIKDGRLFIEDLFRGSGKLSFKITSAPTTLQFGNFDNPAFQRRVTELNLAGKLKLFGEELIKVVNELHTQGVGLTFYTKEVEGAYSVNKYIKELPYYLDLNRNGFFYIWVKGPSGKITPVKVNLNLDENATLDELTNQINQALSEAGFDTGTNYEIRAINREGKLVFQAQDGYAFAFSNDTSGILLSTGINLFFIGTDPTDFSVNPTIVEKPELLASGKMDVSSYRSEKPLFGQQAGGIFKSNSVLTSTDKQQTFDINALYVRMYDNKGENYTYPPIAIWEGNYSGSALTSDLTIEIKDATGTTLESYTLSEGTKITDIPELLGNNFPQVKAEIDTDEGIIKFELDRSKASEGAAYIEISGGGITSLISWDNNVKGYKISVDNTTSLENIVNYLDKLPFIRAYFDENNYLVLRPEPDQTEVYGFELGEKFTGTSPTSPTESFLTFLKSKNIIIPAFRWDGTSEKRILSGLEPLIKPQIYSGDASITPDSSVGYVVKFFDSNGNQVDSQTVSGASSLSDLITNFNNKNGIKAKIEGDKFYIWLDTSETGAPSDAAYFTIEAQDDGSWGFIKTDGGGSSPLTVGEISAYLFDENGDPIDAFDTDDGIIDPFRIEFTADKNLFQVLTKINAPENMQYGLSAQLDREGKLIVQTTGLYQTRSFILQDTTIFPPSTSGSIIPEKVDPLTNRYYYISDIPVSESASFADQTLTITLYTSDGTTSTTTITLNSGDTLKDVINKLNTIDVDGDGTTDLEAGIDDSGKLYIKIKDSDFQKFKIETDLSTDTDGNYVSYLYTHLTQMETRSNGLINNLSGYELKKGDNRIAQAIADASTQTREKLNQSNLENYYASMVGEVGVAVRSVKDSKTFLDDLLRQLKSIKDSISGVSLDEEMTNLIKYQQAFIATSKLLSTVEEMFQSLINAKR